ncbi:hypothetical protein TRFO_27457 [Tritrichomonas foetus]|uniref:RING-type domain-containing protein n=1 Tax=Tritrichomonas foetus TaxID=1144522 RepID=A0A1J4K0J3_9EUKA|nr:hypothetical protein TRFO_27457 [Tritrichomonas foetus]|eukprot:OHT04953.1 hypothetical protein TRFO_27457 [Tritrichomonas foetus]
MGYSITRKHVFNFYLDFIFFDSITMETTVYRSPWDINEKFPRTYAMFALMMLVVFIGRSLCEHFKIIAIVAGYIFTYLFIENQLKDVMVKMAVSSSYFRKVPYFLIPYSILLIAAIVLGFFILDSPKIVPDNNLFSTYMISLLESFIVFMIGSTLKCILLGTGLFSFKVTRRGFFGVFQRVFIIIRNIVVLPAWLGYFCGISPRSLEDLFNAKKPFWCHTYLVMKCFLQLWLLGDLGSVIRDYTFNRRATYRHVNESEVEDDCIICQDKPEEPVALGCGHIFCYKCAYRWLKDHNSCPICRAQILEPKPIEFADGFVPFTTLFSTF